MKPLSTYSSTKFASFTPEQQLAAIDKLIAALEQNLTNEPEFQSLISHILELCASAKNPLPPKLQLFICELHPDLSPHQMLNKLYFYHEGALRKDSQIPLRKGDGSNQPNPELRQKAAQITLICDNLRSVFNVGSLFRSAECLGVRQLYLCGITPTPQHPNMAKTAMGTEKLVCWQHFATTKAAIDQCRQEGCQILALETVKTAKPVFAYHYSLPLAVVLGSESLGLDPEILNICDDYIYLPQLGWKNSFNVGVAAAITLYQIIFGESNGQL